MFAERQKSSWPELGWDGHEFSQAVLDALPHPVLVKDIHGRYLSCNCEFEKWLGTPRAQVVGRTLFDIAPAEFVDECLAMDREVLARGGTRSCEGVLRLADGSERQILVLKVPLYRYGSIDGIITNLIDISDLKNSQRAVRASDEFWRTILDQMHDAVLIIDGRTFRILSANREFLRLFGATSDAVTGRSCHDVVFPPCGLPNQDGHSLCPLGEAGLTGKPTVREHAVATADGNIWLEIATTPIADACGTIQHLVHVFRDITARKEAEREIERLAYFDALTGLPNRTLFLDRLGQAIHLAQRERHPLAVLFLDIDDFKKINDSMGHAAGDETLVAFAKLLRRCVRQSDTLARTGGDEFAILLQSSREVSDVLTAISHIREAFHTPILIDGREVHLQASIGVALFPDDGASAGQLHKHAELAMYEAKEEERETYRFYSQEMNQRVSERLQMEDDLRRALRDGELFLVFHPQVETGSGRVRGVEALVRWRHPVLGVVPPTRFIPLAEETGLILPIGEWVLRQACTMANGWRAKGIDDLRLGVNLSPAQFRRSDLPALVKEVLHQTGFDPCKLELELTEGLLLEKDLRVRACLQDLKALGISLAIDDFGTGYSALGYLKHFPIDRIKIAQEFVREIPASTEHVEIIRAITVMARSLNLGVVVEGVETGEQLDLLVSLGCREIQGFHFSRPLEEDALLHFVTAAGGT